MNKAIFKYFIRLILVCLMLCSVLFVVVTSNQLNDIRLQEMLYYAKLVDYQLDYNNDISEQLAMINPLTYSDHSRITIIDKEGNVIGDSDVDNLDNHLDRSEVEQAILNGQSYTIRYSSTLSMKMMYAAIDVGDYIVRLAIPYTGVVDYINVLWFPILLSVFIVFGLAIIMSKSLAKRLATPVIEISDVVNDLDISKQVEFKQYDYDEYNVVCKAISKQGNIIKEMKQSLQIEKTRIDGLMDRMQEGFILVDHDLKIVLVNAKANMIFDCTMLEGKQIHNYVYDSELLSKLNDGILEQSIVDIKVDKLIYACYISKVAYGISLLFLDVTMSRNATKIRQEFLSNVSHELKTPLTAIKGYSELLNNGMLEDKEKVKKAILTIEKQANHMASLINDILMISRLESKDIYEDIQSIKVDDLVDEVLEQLSYQIEHKGIKVYKECGVELFDCNYQHLHQLFNNILSNAIKYNKEQGIIDIVIKKELNQLIIQVKDEGIGIPVASKQRVFERFYRVNKARDKETGGSGLGLAIVKHIVQFYKGTIDLKSELDVGTTITITLPL